MNRLIVSASVGVLVSTVGVGLAQVHQPKGKDLMGSAATKNIAPMTPAELSRISQESQLDHAAGVALNAGKFAEAEADARASEAVGFGVGLSQEILASALYAQGKDQQALQAYKVMADEGDSFPRNLLPYALLLLKSGHWAQAVAAYDKALPFVGDGDLLQKNSDFSSNVPQPAALAAAIHIGMGLTMDGGGFHGTYQQRCAQALTHFQQAQALEPGNALTHYYYGYGLQNAGQRAQAQAAFQKAADLGSGGVKTAAEAALKGQ